MDLDTEFKSELALLRYSFDQYQRYRDIREVVDVIQVGQVETTLRILDVGGSPTAWKFLAGYQITTANLEVTEAINLQSDGARLPFSDDSFEVVITVDTLEHLPEDRRQAFVHELLRVARTHVIITGPFANGYNEFMEATLNEFLVKAFGIDHRFLQEHPQNGLPALELCQQWLTDRGAGTIAIPSGYIAYWLPLMVIKYSLLDLRDGEVLTADLDILYNYQRYWADHKLPSYRQVVVASKDGNEAGLEAVKRVFARLDEQATPPDLSSVTTMWEALNWQQALKTRDEEISRLQALVEGYRSGRVMRLMAAIRQFFGVLGKAGG